MDDAGSQGRERREHERYDVAFTIDFIRSEGDPERRLRGTTINVSRGGVLVDLGLRVPVGTRCSILFRDVGERVDPPQVDGTVVHVGKWMHGRPAVAVQFDAVLDRLDPGNDG